MTKLLLTALKVMPLPEAVTIPFVTRLVDKKAGMFSAEETHRKSADAMLDELARWADALAVLR
jgi:hypothetical protein